MTDRIGENDVITTRKCIVQDGQIARIEFDAGNWNIIVNAIFNPTAERQSIRIVPLEGIVQIHFDKWDNSLGSATSRPVELGVRADGRHVYFVATNYRIGTINNCDIQFLLGAGVSV
jgi:hypothetical protein